MKDNGFTCCGYDDPSIKWYVNEEHGYSIPARSAEEAERIALQGIARDLSRCKTIGQMYNPEWKAKMARSLRAGHVEMTESCLQDIQRYDNET